MVDLTISFNDGMSFNARCQDKSFAPLLKTLEGLYEDVPMFKRAVTSFRDDTITFSFNSVEDKQKIHSLIHSYMRGANHYSIEVVHVLNVLLGKPVRQNQWSVTLTWNIYE